MNTRLPPLRRRGDPQKKETPSIPVDWLKNNMASRCSTPSGVCVCRAIRERNVWPRGRPKAKGPIQHPVRERAGDVLSIQRTNFTVFGAPIPRDSALTTAGAQLFLTPNWSLLAKFDGESASASQTYAGTGTLRYTW